MSERYYYPHQLDKGNEVRISGDEAHHAVRVMRVRTGDRIVLFDGFGASCRCRIGEVDKKSLRVVVEELLPHEPAPTTDITVAVAFPKKSRQGFLVEKLVELGVSRLVPLETAKSVVKFSDNKVARTGAKVIEASKQCERSRLMDVSPRMRIRELARIAGETPTIVCDASPESPPLYDVLAALSSDGKPQGVVLAVGPEGGFAPEEIDALVAAGGRKARLGPNILRIETAAIATVSAVQAFFESGGTNQPGACRIR